MLLFRVSGTFLAGLAVLAITVVVLWPCLPRDGKMYRLVDTDWGPYVGVAFGAASAVSFTMMLSGLINSLG
jgi:steroid 5-alpha reductase family enzyme